MPYSTKEVRGRQSKSEGKGVSPSERSEADPRLRASEARE
jgi:hypothetical protein